MASKASFHKSIIIHSLCTCATSLSALSIVIIRYVTDDVATGLVTAQLHTGSGFCSPADLGRRWAGEGQARQIGQSP